MTDLSALLAVIQYREVQLHQPATRHNPQLVSQLLHHDFTEISRSGQCYNKRQTVDALKIENDYRQIFAENFKLAMISEDVALLRYQTVQHDENGRAIRRTERASIWVLTLSEQSEPQWQMRFHQGTAIDD